MRTCWFHFSECQITWFSRSTICTPRISAPSNKEIYVWCMAQRANGRSYGIDDGGVVVEVVRIGTYVLVVRSI